MATITALVGTDGITTANSMTKINTNFANLNTGKIETSVLDVDTTLAANSDAKIASQKATKAYVDTLGNVNASTTNKGIVEEATQAEVDAGTATGGTSARLFVNPSTLTTALTAITTGTTAKKYTIGALDNAYVKTYFNVQLLFTTWTGSTAGALTTDQTNWTKGANVAVAPLGVMANFSSTGSEQVRIDGPFPTPTFASTNIIIMDWWAQLPATSTGDICMGFSDNQGVNGAYNASTYSRVQFTQSAAGAMYATISKASVGVTNTDISSGYTATLFNNFRIELDLSNNALFYINGVLKATLSGANLPSTGVISLGFGRSNTANFIVTAPNISIQMNP